MWRIALKHIILCLEHGPRIGTKTIDESGVQEATLESVSRAKPANLSHPYEFVTWQDSITVPKGFMYRGRLLRRFQKEK